jgi:hypothetical protein
MFKTETVTEGQAHNIREREDALRAFLGVRTSYMPEEVAHLNPPTNVERSELEIFEFCRDKPDRYFLYIEEGNSTATTFMGDCLGTVQFGMKYRDNFGGKRQPVRIEAINGETYSGTYYKSSGNYARVRKVKHR